MPFKLTRLAIAVSSIFTLSALPVAAQEDDTTDSSAAPVERIQVVGSQVTLNDEYPGGQVARGGRAGILGNIDMMDSPFSATNFTAELIREQQSESVADVLQNDPVVRVAKGFGNFQELYVMRGFPVYSDDMTYNGLYGILPRQYVTAELLERVEVFRGANAFLNGAAPGGSGLGGSINVVPKRAGDEPLNRITTGYENQGHLYASADLSRRYGNDEESTGVRVNLARRDGETAIDNQDRGLSMASVNVDYDSNNLRLAADLGFQDHQVDAPRPSVTPLGAIPEAPASDINFAQDWTYSDERQLFGAVRAEYDIRENLMAWAAAGFREGEEENVLANPTADENGDFTAYRFDNVREDSVSSFEVGARTTFATGSVGHRAIISASAFSMDSKNAYAFSDFAGFSGNLYDPMTVEQPDADFFIGGDLSSPLVTENTETSSIAIADTLAFRDEQVLLTLGVRYQNIELNSYDYDSGDMLSGYDESQLTPVAGLVVKPSDSISLYANYIEGLIPGEVAPASSGGVQVENAGEVFEPYQAEQYELGVKFDRERFGSTLSLFSTTKPTSLIEDNRFTVEGEQKNQGVELTVFGLPADNLRLLGGLTYLDTEQTRTQDGLLDGNQAIGVPELQLNLNAEWALTAVPGLTLDARAIYTSDQYADAANTVKVEASERFDLGARYSTYLGDTEVTLRARIENLLDNNYWASVGGFPGSNYLMLSEPRTFKLSASFSF
jgi:iron complex outermembrane receptor protein